VRSFVQLADRQEQSSGDQHNLTVQNLPILIDKERPSHYVKEGGNLLQPNQPNSGGLASFRRILFSKAKRHTLARRPAILDSFLQCQQIQAFLLTNAD
jgi:hypothetical protein